MTLGPNESGTHPLQRLGLSTRPSRDEVEAARAAYEELTSGNREVFFLGQPASAVTPPTADGQVGRFTVVPIPSAFTASVLRLDTVTGQAWTLVGTVWQPLTELGEGEPQ